MQWIITRDHINEQPIEMGRGTGVKLDEAQLLPFQFKLYDDDGELYFTGRCGDLNQANQDTAFAPLDWAMSGYGCTTMKYRTGVAKWEVL